MDSSFLRSLFFFHFFCIYLFIRIYGVGTSVYDRNNKRNQNLGAYRGDFDLFSVRKLNNRASYFKWNVKVGKKLTGSQLEEIAYIKRTRFNVHKAINALS